MFLNNAMDRINRLIIQGGRTGMTELQFFAAEIKEWKDSPAARISCVVICTMKDSMTF